MDTENRREEIDQKIRERLEKKGRMEAAMEEVREGVVTKLEDTDYYAQERGSVVSQMRSDRKDLLPQEQQLLNSPEKTRESYEEQVRKSPEYQVLLQAQGEDLIHAVSDVENDRFVTDRRRISLENNSEEKINKQAIESSAKEKVKDRAMG